MIEKIISGGQTGADRAALDFAIANGIPHGGWCPRGRRAEDGVIPDKYQLQQYPSELYPPRTAANVKEGDATIIFNLTGKMERGCALTIDLCLQMNKPYLLIDHDQQAAAGYQLAEFLIEHQPKILNVAGNRLSKCDWIEEYVKSVLYEGIFGYNF